MSIEEFKFARDFLLALGDNYHAAKSGFVWPRLERFNWALDWFDGELAKGEHGARPALKIVGTQSETYTFAELSQRSSALANGLRALGAVRGDRMLLMLGNVAPLWIATLAAMKLGLVVIPATPLLAGADIDDRLARGRARFILADAADAGKFEGRGEGAERIAVGAAPEGWRDFDALLDASAHFEPDGPTRADDPLLLYFTSGTTARPKLALHSHASYPIGHLSTMYGLGLRPGDVHLNISSPGWAKHAWSSFFAPWNAGATILALTGRFETRATLDALVAHEATSFCAPPTVWRQLVQLDLRQWKVGVARSLLFRRAAQPGSDRTGAPRLGSDVARFLRPDGDDDDGRQLARPEDRCRLDGPAAAGLPHRARRRRRLGGRSRRNRRRARAAARRPDARLSGRRGRARGDRRRLLPHRRHRGPRRGGRLTYVGRADDVFKSSDYRLSPFELESALIEHPAVAEAAVVPAPDAIRLTIPKAYVVLAEGHAPDRATALSIFAFLRDRLAPYKRIRRIEFSELPKTISGKIRRVDLRAREDALAAESGRAEREFRLEDFPELG